MVTNGIQELKINLVLALIRIVGQLIGTDRAGLKRMTKEIHLTRGKVALVDDDDYEYLNQFKWCASSFRSGKYYRAERSVSRKLVLMHRAIMNCPDGMCVDHINHNTLDNRKENLRICTNWQNKMNQKVQVNNTSGYKNVSFVKSRSKWRSRIKFKSKEMHIGYFNSKIEAALAHDEYASQLYGEFALLNFPAYTDGGIYMSDMDRVKMLKEIV